jgi:hypothetical protein
VTARERAQAGASGAAAGLFGGLFGVGGGIILVPLLSGLFGLTQHRAHGTSLAVIIATALAAAPVYALHGNVDWTTALLVAATSLIGAPLGARLAARLSSRALTRAFAVFLVLVAARLLLAPPHAASGHGLHGVARGALDLALGGAVGLLAGFMGVGGGILAVPAFTLLLGMPQQLAQGTSLVVILGAACAGTAENARRGNVAAGLVPWLAIGAVLGGPVASWWVQRLPQAALARAFALFLLANAVASWLRAGRPKTA